MDLLYHPCVFLYKLRLTHDLSFVNYLFGSRILTHILFWIGYFLLFGYIWEKGNGYAASYLLEFVLLPVRIGVAYAAMYWLLPNVLLKKEFLKFILMFLSILLAGAMLQVVFIHFFYDRQTTMELVELFNASQLLRSMLLINTTALFILALKILKLYFEERAVNQPVYEERIEVKADKRYYRIHPMEILYLEGLGNYVTYHLPDERKIIGYNSLKKAKDELPDYFIRIHKSYIVNSRQVISYDGNSVEIQKDQFLPIGNSYDFQVK